MKVYRNLNNGLWSNKGIDLETKRERVLFHSHEQKLKNVIFKVQEGARLKVLEKKQRSVHAYAQGELCDNTMNIPAMVEVTYNPYNCGFFYRKDNGEKVERAEYAYFTSNHKLYVHLYG
jgi:hypothetical protein